MNGHNNSFTVTGSNSNGRGFALTKENILFYSNGGRDFYEFVIQGLKLKNDKVTFENCRNPFYEDNNPSFSIYMGSDNNWYFKDFGDDKFKGDVFNFAAHYYKLDCQYHFHEILEKINNALSLGLKNISETQKHNDIKYMFNEVGTTIDVKEIEVVRRKDFSNSEIRFFKQYKIDRRTLEQYNVITLESYINEKGLRVHASEQNPIIAYQINKNCYKLYKPYEIKKEYKFSWLGIKPESYKDVYGLEQIPDHCDTILITEGYKDCLTVVANYSQKGVFAVGLDQARTKISKEVVDFLKKKCNNLFICLDIDDAGTEASMNIMKEHCLKRILLPSKLMDIKDSRTGKPFKDISDYIHLYNTEPFQHNFITRLGLIDLIDDAINAPFEVEHFEPVLEPEEIKRQSRLEKLMHSEAILKENKSKPVTFSRPIITREGDGVIYPNTINVIQGKSGVHKSRLAEIICSCLLTKSLNQDKFLGYKADPLKVYSICLVDTERNMKEQLPYAIQRIQTKAGYSIEEDLYNFKYVSLLEIEREERLLTIADYLDYIRLSYSNHIFIVLDVITDCISNFNDPKESLKLIDLMNSIINKYDVTFLCLIHENPGSADKARGHLGTEIFNKASTVIQIGFEKDANHEDTEILKVKYLKCRSTARLHPFYIRYSEEAKGLILADDTEIKEVAKSRKKKAPVEDIKDKLEEILTETTRKQELYDKLMIHFDCSDKVINERLEELTQNNPIFTNVEGKPCTLVREQIGREVFFRLKIQKPIHEE